MRRGASLDRQLDLWKKQSSKSSLTKKLMVYYSREKGLDDREIHIEILTEILSDIKSSVFSVVFFCLFCLFSFFWKMVTPELTVLKM